MVLDELLRNFGRMGLEQSFEIEGRAFRVFAYPSPGRGGTSVRWNLYEEARRPALRGLSFGIAPDVRQALEAVVESASEHAREEPCAPPRRAYTFRPESAPRSR